ncbi:site-specific recombinase [Vulgatibacter incomptus]|uniref:Site-specific recombinase n=1 Tax=Vulgatibacter incomptus TaxID=1391653 RepID=A0A0K1PFZ4_9BACT|nr:hypothetical protein [Vulgatibacter incomptus]AKU92034.1 Site-specific recombinase [Vulgatibacter incomptus]
MDERTSNESRAPLPNERALRQLATLLAKRPGPDDDPERSLTFLRKLAAWMFAGGDGVDDRLSALVASLREDSAAAADLGACIRRVLEGGQAARLFSSAGLPSRPGILAEAGRRIAEHVLPEPPADGNLVPILRRLFPDRESGDRLAALSPELVDEVLRLLGNPLSPLQEGISSALQVVAARVCAIGLSDDFVERAGLSDPSASAFLQLPFACKALADAPASEVPAVRSACLEAAAACRMKAAEVQARLEEGGVSVDLVYRLKQIDLGLERIERLARLTGAGGDVGAGVALAASLVSGAAREGSLRALARENVQLLSRKIVEHAGATGGHYITSTRGEYVRMLGSAGGGGVLTAGTTLAKFWIVAAKLPLLVEWMASALNYAGSFVTMQLMGFTLATKQPSVTAAALARGIGARAGGEWSEVVARITRSQLAAAAGNLGLVVPAVLLAERLLRRGADEALLGPEKARYVIGSLDPFTSGTIFYAALTGVLLWISSVLAGAAQNWAIYRRLPESLAASPRVRRILGKAGASWLQRFVAGNVGGIAGNVSLGVMLALTPLVGNATGLPLDVRHVTLSTGSLTLAVSSLGWGAIASWGFFAALFGIVTMALLNFGVSFALALVVAMRSEGITRADRSELLRALAAKLRREPWDFVRPPPPTTTSAAPIAEG